MNLLMPLLAWVVALATMAGAAMELRHQQALADTNAALAFVPEYVLQPNALSLKDYQAIQKKTTVFGSVDIAVSANALSVKASALSDYAAWRLALDQVLLDNPGVTWKIESLCSGKCSSGEAHKAVLQGSRMSGLVQDRGRGDALPVPKTGGSVSSSPLEGRYADSRSQLFGHNRVLMDARSQGRVQVSGSVQYQ